MRIDSVIHILNICARAQIASFMWGPPGAGKSETAYNLTKWKTIKYGDKEIDNFLYGYEVIDRRLSNCQPSDLKGLPDKYKNRLTFVLPDFFPESEESALAAGTTKEEYNYWLKNEGKVILFLDEFNLANQQVQGAGYSIILDREIDGRKLHPNVVVMAAGNQPPEDEADAQVIVNAVSEALLKRFAHIPLDQNYQDQLAWFSNKQDMNKTVFAFFQDSEEIFKGEATQIPFEYAKPSGRQVEFASRLFNKLDEDEAKDTNLLTSLMETIFLSTIATSFTQWLEEIEKAYSGELIVKSGTDSSIMKQMKEWNDKGQLPILRKTLNNTISYLDVMKNEKRYLEDKEVVNFSKSKGVDLNGNFFNYLDMEKKLRKKSSISHNVMEGLLTCLPDDLKYTVAVPRGIDGETSCLPDLVAILSQDYSELIDRLAERVGT